MSTFPPTRRVAAPATGDKTMSGTVIARNTTPAPTALRSCTCWR